MSAYTIPAIAGNMGSTPYYQANMKARELAAVAKTAGELEAWKDWSIFERFQRDLATKRVEQEIVPYLVRTKDRFFGALIVLVYAPDVFEFQSIESMGTKPPAAYRAAAQRMGFLTIRGGELVVLDGQHRLAALRAAVTDDGSRFDGPYRDAIADDELCVVFIHHETFEKTRRIFNKVNRYAKPTSPSDNIITSEDDGCAIVARWLVEKNPPLGLSKPIPPLAQVDFDGEPLVEWRSTSLGSKDRKFTTLSALYQTVEAVLEANGIKNFDEKHRVNRPTDDELTRAYKLAAKWWEAVATGLDPVADALAKPGRIPDMRQYNAASSLLMRPVTHVALFRGLADAVVKYGVPLDEAVELANRLRWKASDPMWQDTIIYANGRMNAKAPAIRLAGRLITYMIAGSEMTDFAKLALRSDLAEAKGLYAAYELPKAIG
jgi:DNA sulfur modification protein DndB